ncbi:MAG: hypothetical protein Tsb005_10880 [Gammaproteobacteria bacterium]
MLHNEIDAKVLNLINALKEGNWNHPIFLEQDIITLAKYVIENPSIIQEYSLWEEQLWTVVRRQIAIDYYRHIEQLEVKTFPILNELGNFTKEATDYLLPVMTTREVIDDESNVSSLQPLPPLNPQQKLEFKIRLQTLPPSERIFYLPLGPNYNDVTENDQLEEGYYPAKRIRLSISARQIEKEILFGGENCTKPKYFFGNFKEKEELQAMVQNRERPIGLSIEGPQKRYLVHNALTTNHGLANHDEMHDWLLSLTPANFNAANKRITQLIQNLDTKYYWSKGVWEFVDSTNTFLIKFPHVSSIDPYFQFTKNASIKTNTLKFIQFLIAGTKFHSLLFSANSLTYNETSKLNTLMIASTGWAILFDMIRNSKYWQDNCKFNVNDFTTYNKGFIDESLVNEYLILANAISLIKQYANYLDSSDMKLNIFKLMLFDQLNRQKNAHEIPTINSMLDELCKQKKFTLDFARNNKIFLYSLRATFSDETTNEPIKIILDKEMFDESFFLIDRIKAQYIKLDHKHQENTEKSAYFVYHVPKVFTGSDIVNAVDLYMQTYPIDIFPKQADLFYHLERTDLLIPPFGFGFNPSKHRAILVEISIPPKHSIYPLTCQQKITYTFNQHSNTSNNQTDLANEGYTNQALSFKHVKKITELKFDCKKLFSRHTETDDKNDIEKTYFQSIGSYYFSNFKSDKTIFYQSSNSLITPNETTIKISSNNNLFFKESAAIKNIQQDDVQSCVSKITFNEKLYSQASAMLQQLTEQKADKPKINTDKNHSWYNKALTEFAAYGITKQHLDLCIPYLTLASPTVSLEAELSNVRLSDDCKQINLENYQLLKTMQQDKFNENFTEKHYLALKYLCKLKPNSAFENIYLMTFTLTKTQLEWIAAETKKAPESGADKNSSKNPVTEQESINLFMPH